MILARTGAARAAAGWTAQSARRTVGVVRTRAVGTTSAACSASADPRLRQIVGAHLLAADVDGACEWYGHLMPEWQIRRDVTGAATVMVGDVQVASMSQARTDEQPRWLPVVSVGDSPAAKVSAAGGRADEVAESTWLVTDPDGGELLLAQLPGPRHQPLHERQPPPGHVNWGDVLAADGREEAQAAFYTNVLGWTQQAPIHMPAEAGGGMYITLLDGRGVRNRDKMCGVLPRRLLTPWLDQTMWLSCFSVAGKEACEKRLKLAADTGGVARFGPFAADGWICIVQDPQGAFCGVYSREDVWDAVKDAADLKPADVDGVHD